MKTNSSVGAVTLRVHVGSAAGAADSELSAVWWSQEELGR